MRYVSRELVARVLLSVMWLWLGATSLSDLGARIVSGHLGDHALLAGLAEGIPPGVAAGLVGALQILAAVLLILPGGLKRIRRWGAVLSAVLAALPLTLLFTNPVWMERLGGFPAIGSGQGLLKYPAVVGLSIYLAGVDRDSEAERRWGMHLTVGGLILPLLWIGGMKFTLPEAQGIVGLLASSWVFSWMGDVFTVQGASNVIGALELVTVVFLAAYWFRPAWSVVGGVLGIGTFLSTLSFLVSVPGWRPDSGFPMLSGTGVFLIKDLALLAASTVIVLDWWERKSPAPRGTVAGATNRGHRS